MIWVSRPLLSVMRLPALSSLAILVRPRLPPLLPFLSSRFEVSFATCNKMSRLASTAANLILNILISQSFNIRHLHRSRV